MVPHVSVDKKIKMKSFSYFYHAVKSLIPASLMRCLQQPYHFFLAFCAALIYRFPSRKLTVIGITGTKGKTSVVELLHAILAANGSHVASVSSLRFRINDQEFPNNSGMTMPGRFFLQKFFCDAIKSGCTYVIIEVTSQGVEQYRHRFINFHMGVMTNISAEHIEAHGGFEPYLRSKLDFFWRLPKNGVAVINKDDEQANRFSAAAGCEKAWFSKELIEYKKNVWPIRNLNVGNFGIMVDIKGHQIKSSLQGNFNVENIYAATAVALVLRVPLEKITHGIGGVWEIPGRMEIIQDKPVRVVVDYAHTPDSLERVYESLRAKTDTHNPHRLICVLGAAGGGRDTWKRPELGKIAVQFCEEIIITNEDPFDESPEHIMEDVATGVRQSQYTGALRIIGDRREAIRSALGVAHDGDSVVITGKGSESYIRVGRGERIAWSDAAVVREELRAVSLQ
ncbi:MAG: UDP-N-acetylmuramoyl-L-alanyl-D-glutamate--2,6-diaminopimelate ligase [Candidatus Sungbacteria bacterium]|nr:UDP-N-acetylmuramoyl-L-alanyl-D-glutamate--2,6-diaminopimelate ligase [bacterium]MDZ4260672.1 UDP-N-acetylmuramoyl-L-alanyl-D-glutamate--2,6-diaminopimelate ligase [Candidatus Sungbacteria bacterium]